MKIAITGSGGLLGNSILQAAKAKGATVYKIHFPASDECIFFDSVVSNLVSIDSCDYVINCAASKSPKQPFDFYLNSKVPRIIESYIIDHNLSCKLIHISSINVLIDSLRDKYTKSKKIGEESLVASSTIIVRPGLIWAPDLDPLLLRISTFFRKSYMPKFMLKPGNLYNPVHPQVLANFIIDYLERGFFTTRAINVMGENQFSLWDLMEDVAQKNNSKLIPIPTSFFRFIPWAWGIDNLGMGEIFNQMLTIDRSKISLRDDDLVVLPFNG